MNKRIISQRLITFVMAGLFILSLVFNARGVFAQSDAFYSASGQVEPGVTNSFGYPIFSGINYANLRISATGEAGGILEVTFTDGSGGPTPAFSRTVLAGETLWAPVALKPSNNLLTIKNVGTARVTYDIRYYSRDTAPFTWSGVALKNGTWNATTELNFATSGMYRFTFSGTTAPYQFFVDGEYFQKTIPSDQVVDVFIPSGVHELKVVQSSLASAPVAWNVAIAATGQANDSLPYSKSGGELGGPTNTFNTEWLPLSSSSAVEANFRLDLAGSATDTLQVALYQGAVQVGPAATAFGGETLWWNLPIKTGLYRLKLVSSTPTGALSYDLTISAKPAASASNTVNFAGNSLGSGSNSQFIFEAATNGLYTFTLDASAGRYQWLVDPAELNAPSTGALTSGYIIKTAEGANTVNFYLAAGQHQMRITQDALSGQTDWTMSIKATGAANDSLPYTKAGGELGGLGNQFGIERLPIQLATATNTNLSISLLGDANDALDVTVLGGGANVITNLRVYGGETVWINTDLPSGFSQLLLAANPANLGALSYSLGIQAAPNLPAAWQGIADTNGINSTLQFRVPADGVYVVDLTNDSGFSQVIVDSANLIARSAVQAGSYQIALTAGLHQLKIIQSNTYLVTGWNVSVASQAPGSQLAHFSGTLSPGETLDPVFPWHSDQNVQVNMRLDVQAAVAGETLKDPSLNDLTFTVTNGASQTAFTGNALQGERLWASTTLTKGLNTFTFYNSSPIALTYDLLVYTIPSTPMLDWNGSSKGAGTWNSFITLNFPSAGLYTFQSSMASGRYQYILDSNYLQQTVDAAQISATPGTAHFFVSAGQHTLSIVQDPQAVQSNWQLGINGPATPADSLPVSFTSQDLGGSSNAFGQEWMPIALTAESKTNIEIKMTGSAQDAVDVTIYGGASGTQIVFAEKGIYGGETIWWPVTLAAGVSRIEVVANPANTSPLAYQLTVFKQAEASTAQAAAWSGQSTSAGNPSVMHFSAATAGLYEFQYGLDSGRYQFIIDAVPASTNPVLQKTIEDEGSVTYYLPAGEHSVTIEHDRTMAQSAWSLDIQATGTLFNSLPYQQSGGLLGGAGNSFDTEWLNLVPEAAANTNFSLTLSGDAADTLLVSLYSEGAAIPIYTQTIYGGETLWWPANLLTGITQMKLVADPANVGPLSYAILAQARPTPLRAPGLTWSGVSKNTGQSSQIQLQITASGMYHFILDAPAGAANLLISPIGGITSTNLPVMRQHNLTNLIEFDVHLETGIYRVEVQQNTSIAYPFTNWQLAVIDPRFVLFMPAIAKPAP